MSFRTALRALIAGLVSVVALCGATLPAQAVQTAQTAVVNPNPVSFTPHVLDGKVNAIAQVGNTINLGGRFTQVRESSNQTVLARTNLMAFNATTGAISTTFVPNVNDEVTTLIASPDGQTVYVAGYFTSVNNVTRRYVTRLNVCSTASAGTRVAGPR